MSWQFVVPSERSIIRRCCCKHHIFTKLVFALFAKVARPATLAGFEGYTIPNFEVFDLGTNFRNDTGRLVTKDHRLLDHKVGDAAMNEVVDVRSANTRLLHLHEHITITNFRYRLFLENHILDTTEDERSVW
jgi:hypothetical protein